jgi:Universal stress protein family
LELYKTSCNLSNAETKILTCGCYRVFQNRVSFDTFEKKYEGLATSFTLVKKHKDYEYTRQTRTFLCGIDDNDYSEYALEWLIDELVDDGDEIVCLRVVEKDSSVAGPTSIEEGKYRIEAERAMKFVKDANHENKAINIIVEFAVGKVEKVITSMVSLRLLEIHTPC